MSPSSASGWRGFTHTGVGDEDNACGGKGESFKPLEKLGTRKKYKINFKKNNNLNPLSGIWKT